MAYNPENIQVLRGLDAVRRRPGMYLGDTGRLGAARLVQSAIDTLTELTVRRDDRLWYRHHAFLDVSLTQRTVTTAIDYHPEDCPDIDTRCQSLADNRHNLRLYPYALHDAPNSVSNIAVLGALTHGLHIARPDRTVLASDGAAPITFPPPTKGALIAAQFTISDQIATEGLTLDYLTGFLEGAKTVPGLVLKSVTIA